MASFNSSQSECGSAAAPADGMRSSSEQRGEGALPLLDKLRLEGQTAAAAVARGTCENTAARLRRISTHRCFKTRQAAAVQNQ